MVEPIRSITRLLECEYEQTGNPLYLFLAYQECRKADAPIDEWILSYFDSVAEQIFNEVEERKNGVDPGNRRDGAFLRDFMAKCRGDIFNRFIENQKHIKACIRYAELKAKDIEQSDLNIRLEIDKETGNNYKTLEGWIKNYTDAFSRQKKEMETQEVENAAINRYANLRKSEPDRPIVDILQQISEETGIARIRLNALINIKLKSI